MSKRDSKLYLADLLDSAHAIKNFVQDIGFEEFSHDRKTYSTTLREYSIIGEAVSALMDTLEKECPSYPWRMVKDFRNFIVHEYFGVDTRVVWDLTMLELDDLIHNVQMITQNVS